MEAALRAATGIALVVAAPELPFARMLRLTGWFLLITALAMPLLPDLHRSFAQRAVGAVAPHIRLVGIGAIAGALALGLLLGGQLE